MITPEPFTTPDIDLRDMDGFLLNAERLLASELWALSTGEEFKAAMGLWCRAWKQMPAASLPNDDRVLASFAGVTPKRWAAIRTTALRGFVLCSDGRLYHRVLCEDARRAHAKKSAFRTRAQAGAKERWKDKPSNAQAVLNDAQYQGPYQGPLQETNTAPSPSPSSASDDYPATTATTPLASPPGKSGIDIPTAAHRFRAANAVQIAKAAKARDLLAILSAFGANPKYPEWGAVTDGMRLACVVTVLGLAVANGGVIRAPSGFRTARKAWEAMTSADRTENRREQCSLYGVEIPAKSKVSA